MPPPSPPPRRGILLFCAAIILLFAYADFAVLERFSPAAFGVRAVWAALTVWAAFVADAWTGRRQRALFHALGVWTSGFFAAVVWLTGGASSTLFHWLMAMPVLVAVCLQEFPPAIVLSGVTAVLAGIALLLAGGAGSAEIVVWTPLAVGMSALAAYASVGYQRLSSREQEAVRNELSALRKARTVDEEVQARLRAEDEVRTRDDFLSVASHELRTPLTALNLQLHSLRHREGGALGDERLEAIDRQVRRLGALVETLFDVSRVHARGVSPQRAEVDLCALTREVVERMAPVAAQLGSQVTLEGPAQCRGMWDRGRLDQVLTNLLANALKYGQGRPVRMEISGDADRVRVRVRDGGIGIAPEDHARIFQRFERAVSARHFGGLGLGLWLARELVRAHGGEITVQSAPGLGAEFTVELPLAGAAEAEGA